MGLGIAPANGPTCEIGTGLAQACTCRHLAANLAVTWKGTWQATCGHIAGRRQHPGRQMTAYGWQMRFAVRLMMAAFSIGFGAVSLAACILPVVLWLAAPLASGSPRSRFPWMT